MLDGKWKPKLAALEMRRRTLAPRGTGERAVEGALVRADVPLRGRLAALLQVGVDGPAKRAAGAAARIEARRCDGMDLAHEAGGARIALGAVVLPLLLALGRELLSLELQGIQRAAGALLAEGRADVVLCQGRLHVEGVRRRLPGNRSRRR